jgi:hypothetical protein
MDDESQFQFPSALKELFRVAITDHLASHLASSRDIDDQSVNDLSSRGKEALNAIKRTIDGDPELASRFFDSHDWCDDDFDRTLAVDLDTNRYIEYAVKQQVATGRLKLSDADFETLWQKITEFACRATLDWTFLAPLKRFELRDVPQVELGTQFLIRALAESEKPVKKQGEHASALDDSRTLDIVVWC